MLKVSCCVLFYYNLVFLYFYWTFVFFRFYFLVSTFFIFPLIYFIFRFLIFYYDTGFDYNFCVIRQIIFCETFENYISSFHETKIIKIKTHKGLLVVPFGATNTELELLNLQKHYATL